MSWNKIGSAKEIFNKFALNMSNNESILHLDISHNNIDKHGIVELDRDIKHNTTLIGLHLAGNEGLVDGCGYVKTITSTAVMSSFNERGLDLDSNQYNCNMRKNCWICEKWVPVEFKIQNVEEPVFIHLEWYD